uniref:CASP-like protein n=1 Tax=Triticum urartu TaxID=4572 RepID=A0A8R7PZ86_TRIUA
SASQKTRGRGTPTRPPPSHPGSWSSITFPISSRLTQARHPTSPAPAHSHHLPHSTRAKRNSNCHRSTPGRTPSASPPHLSAASRAEQGMKRVVGSPGTWSGMALRLSQCVFAAASVFSMVSGFGYSNYSAFFYMNLALILQIMWSLGLACKDIFALRNKKDLHTPDNLLIIVMVDWVSRSLCLFYYP